MSVNKAQAFLQFRQLVFSGSPCDWSRTGQDRARRGKRDRGPSFKLCRLLSARVSLGIG